MSETAIDLRVEWLNETGLLCLPPEGPLDAALQERFWGLADRLLQEPFVREVVPGMNNLLVVIDPFAVSGEAARALCLDRWRDAPVRATEGRVHDLPVRYGGSTGEDLAHVAAVAGLSPADYVRRHAAGTYTVFALGSQPGFGYLAGLDPALAVPRRDTPRSRVDSGSVVIGGAQAGVISRTSPSGWHIIGMTGATFFDPAREPPSLLAPGDRVRFVIEDVSA